MQLTMSGEYALRAMLYICSEPNGTTFKISDVAKKNDIPDNFLRKLVQQLKRAGLLKSTQGNGGGISLNVEAEKITPLDIIEIVEGKIGLNKCLIHNDFCNRDNYCSIHIIWDEAQTQLRDKLKSKSMRELALQNSQNLTNVNNLF